MEPILTLQNVGFRYAKEWVLRGLSLEVNAGEILAVLGPNGSGKSTLLKVMDGILIPQRGQVRLRDRPLGRLKRSALAREVAMVAQENHFRFSFTALEVVLMGRFAHLKRFQFEGPGDMRIARRALEAAHALNLAERSIHSLSGGEKQRVLLARALAQEPQVILLDEPTSFLDLKYKREIFQLIVSLSRGKGLTVIVVSHDLDLAAQYSQKLVMLREGSVFQIGPPEQVITAATIETVYDCPVVVDTNPVTGGPRVNLAG
jgi:iron complex transport system ATP-binding protein